MDLLYRAVCTVHMEAVGRLVERVELVLGVVAVVPPPVVLVDVLAAVGSVLAANHEDERGEHCGSGDADVHADAEVIASTLHHVASIQSEKDNQLIELSGD